nr:MAG TPA: hypothetical protein [Caudoviricetes sp.]
MFFNILDALLATDFDVCFVFAIINPPFLHNILKIVENDRMKSRIYVHTIYSNYTNHRKRCQDEQN